MFYWECVCGNLEQHYPSDSKCPSCGRISQMFESDEKSKLHYKKDKEYMDEYNNNCKLGKPKKKDQIREAMLQLLNNPELMLHMSITEQDILYDKYVEGRKDDDLVEEYGFYKTNFIRMKNKLLRLAGILDKNDILIDQNYSFFFQNHKRKLTKN